MRQPEDKIKVFISSKMGDTTADEKYVVARKAVREILEATNLFSVYLFEDKGASILPAVDHYSQALINSDVCVFLIDNKDGVPAGVQTELDTAEKYKIPSLYYFCDQWESKKTQVQISLQKSFLPKHISVVSFASFVEKCPIDLIESVVDIFKISGKPLRNNELIDDELSLNVETEDKSSNDTAKSQTDSVPISKISQEVENIYRRKSLLLISKKTTENKLCRNYFEYLLLEHDLKDSSKEFKNFDFYSRIFLKTMFEGTSIEEFNCTLMLESLKDFVPSPYFEIVKMRWDSNIKFYMNDFEESFKILTEAYVMACANKESIDDWFIDDILIDLRNRQNKMLEVKNQFMPETFAQREFNKRESRIYYPVLDRNEKNLLNWIDKDRQKNDLRSYNAWSSYGDLSSITNYIADFYYQAMMFGSLTQLQRVYQLVQKFTYHLSRSTEYWPSILMMIKTTIVNLDYKGANQISRDFSEILQKMNKTDARDIYEFSMNAKPADNRFISNLIAMTEVGYYLSDEDFKIYWSDLEQKVLSWRDDKDSTISMESYIFRCLERISDRLDDDFIVEFSLRILSSEKKRYYRSALKLISTNFVDYSKVNQTLTNNVIDFFVERSSENINFNEKDQIQNIFIMVKNFDENHQLIIDSFLQEMWPDFYVSEYKFEKDKNVNSADILLNNLIYDINQRNLTQGKNGVYSMYRSDPYLNAKNILSVIKNPVDNELIQRLFKVTSETILSSRQTINEKVSAYRLAIVLLKMKPELITQNKYIVDSLLKLTDFDQARETMISHIDNVVSLLCHYLLLECLGKNKFKEIAGTISLFGNFGRQVEGCKILEDFLTNHENVKIRPSIEALILQSILLWTNSENIDVRWYNVRLQVKFYELKRYRKLIGQNLQSIASEDNAIVKSQILHRLEDIRIYDSKLAENILMLAENDNNFVIRKIISKKAGA